MKRAVLATLLTVAVIAPAQAATPKVDGEFDVGEVPHHLALGPDGNVWVALEGKDVARVAPDGTVKVFTVPDIATPNGITAGPDGKLWVTQNLGVVRFSPSDPEATGHLFAADISDPRGITTGPDGNLWTGSADKVIRITPAGVVTTFTVPGMSAKGISAGTDGRLYVADFSGRVVVMTAGGTSSFITTGGGPQETATGAPGGPPATFTNPGAVPQTIGFLPAGLPPQTIEVPQTDPFGIVLGDDGAHWIADFATNTLTRLAADRTISTLSPGFSAGARYLTVGPGHTLWVGLELANKVARVTGVEPPPPPEPQPQPQPQPQPTVDTTAPMVTSLTTRAKLRRGRTPVVTFTLSETATVTITLQRRRPGRKVRGRCVAPTRKHRTAPRCQRFVSVLSKMSALAAGAQRVTLRRPNGRHLALGSYRLSLTARDSAGNSSAPLVRTFRVVRR
jgi:virginiamycin B lyase